MKYFFLLACSFINFYLIGQIKIQNDFNEESEEIYIYKYDYEKIEGNESSYLNLKTLYISDETLTELPPTFSNLPSLEKLVIYNAENMNMNEVFNVIKSTNLTNLYINKGDIQLNDSTINSINNKLEELTFNNCQLNFHKEFKNLVISKLKLINNKLSKSDIKIISQNRYIKELRIIEKEEMDFPYSLSRMKNLSILSIDGLIPKKYNLRKFWKLYTLEVGSTKKPEINFMENEKVQIFYKINRLNN